MSGTHSYYGSNYNQYSPAQIDGSEYGGTVSRNTVQPKGADALTPGDILRLGYLVGDTSDPTQQSMLSLEDRRQMLGLKPAGDRRPVWLANTNRVPLAEMEGAVYPDPISSDTLQPEN
jgi:hypothetical protein